MTNRSFINRSFLLSIFLTSFLGKGFCHGPSSSQEANNTSSYCVFKETSPTLEGKAGYFFFLSSKMRKIYNKGGIDAQITGTYPIYKGLDFYGSVEFLQRRGNSLGDKERSTIYQIPVNVGLKPTLTLCDQLQYYVAVGPRYFYVHQHNDSSYMPKNKGHSGVGFFANTGFKFIPVKRFVIDIFGEYSWAKTNFHDAKNNVYGRDVQIGGLTFGGGLGYAF